MKTRLITTSRTIKFEAFEERKSPPPPPTVTTVTSESNSSSNCTQPIHSNNHVPSTDTPATITQRSQTAIKERDTEDSVPSITNACHQPETKKSPDNQSRPTSPHKSINDFQVGQKVRVDGLQLTIKIAEIDLKKGILRDEEGTAFKWERCQIVDQC